MLKIAKSVEYAIFALKHISERSELNCVSTKEISDNMNIPYDLLAKILQKLAKENLIVSVQGTKGGYTLVHQPGEINLTQIINAVEQKIQLTDCMIPSADASDCGRIHDCCIRSPLSKIQFKLDELFQSTTLSEII